MSLTLPPTVARPGARPLKRLIARTPIVGRIASVLWRLRLPAPYIWQVVRSSAKWLISSRETTNYTYDLTERNVRHLAEFVATVTGCPWKQAIGYIEELTADEGMSGHISRLTKEAGFGFKSDAAARFGRRLGWYAVARSTKPRCVVETGVDKGLGSCVICAALLRNQAEGHPGRYYGTDIDPNAGFLLAAPYKDVGAILYGDSIESLNALSGSIDLFISDSDHSPEYEAREYEAVKDKLSERAIVLADNAHHTDVLLEFAHATGRRFLFFGEDTGGFWYPGGGIGAAYRTND